MIGMKADMAGGAAVIGAMQIIGMLNLPLRVVGLIPASDNMISSTAFRPQEVVTASNGKTIEIISTDAEGRLLLADALVYAKRYNPAAVVDIATLTGACIVALGSAAAGFFCTDDHLRDLLQAAGNATHERLWQLPLYPEYKKAIESDTADMKNTGGRNSGVGTSAVFLQQFIDYPAWAHIDMAGVMLDLADNPYIPAKGGSGYGARLLAEFVRLWGEKS
jgi:leucyl aminopeptidase